MGRNEFINSEVSVILDYLLMDELDLMGSPYNSPVFFEGFNSLLLTHIEIGAALGREINNNGEEP